MPLGRFGKWVAFGTGVGIEVGAENLYVALVRVSPSGPRLLGATAIEGFRSRPAAEWGSEYAAFLRRMGGAHLAATVLLPRREVTVRQVVLPGVTDRDLGAAMEFQLEGLHPFPEEEAVSSWARLGKSPAVLVGITRKTVLDRYTSLFAEAGVKVRSLTFSAAVLHTALRMVSTPPESFLALHYSETGLELYGESPARAVFSALLDMPLERAQALAASELRLSPDLEPLPLAQLLPSPKAAPAEFDLHRWALPYAAALAGACPWLALPVNLLPPELRQSSSRMVYVPTVALASVALLLLVGVIAQGTYQDRRHLAFLESEIARLEPQARRQSDLDREIAAAQARIQLIDNFRRRAKADLDVLNELTRLLAPPIWLSGMEISRDTVILGGEAEQAAPLLKLLDGSPMFRDSEFTTPIARQGAAETFRIRAVREGVVQ